MPASVTQLDCWFEGHVQGVGFRYQTTRVARGFDVCGSVRNLPDGRVHLRAEGDEAEVRAFVAEVERELEDYIRGSETRTATGPRSCDGFRIVP